MKDSVNLTRLCLSFCQRGCVIDQCLSVTVLDSPRGRGGCACIQPSLWPSNRRRGGRKLQLGGPWYRTPEDPLLVADRRL